LNITAGIWPHLFPQDDRTFSTLIHVPANDAELDTLRHQPRWDLAVSHIPVLAPWTDPDRSEPITELMRGGLLTNTYRGQLNSDGDIAVAGLLFVGDAVNTTNPHRGRGLSLGLQQAAELLRLFDQDPSDLRGVAGQFDAWCAENIRPWFDDQVCSDAALLARFGGHDIDASGRLPSEVICDAMEADPTLQPVVGPYLAMQAQPASLRVLEGRVRELLRGGWRRASRAARRATSWSS
jgi:hypothetical protein